MMTMMADPCYDFMLFFVLSNTPFPRRSSVCSMMWYFSFICTGRCLPFFRLSSSFIWVTYRKSNSSLVSIVARSVRFFVSASLGKSTLFRSLFAHIVGRHTNRRAFASLFRCVVRLFGSSPVVRHATCSDLCRVYFFIRSWDNKKEREVRNRNMSNEW